MTEQPNRCPDCGAATGAQHDEGCDVARCLWTGMQRLSCAHWLDYTDEPENDPLVINPDDPHRCGHDTWTGHWPGKQECAAFGWWIYWDGPDAERGWDYRGRGWVRVSANHPRATPDLNRLVQEAEWDREERRWVLAR